jgi:hypothetical protein
MEYTVRVEPKAKWACFNKDDKYYEVNIIDLENDEIQDALSEAVILHNIESTEGE